jgi:alkylation response protein AidB-like acyl-CoA dehydrogenase
MKIEKYPKNMKTKDAGLQVPGIPDRAGSNSFLDDPEFDRLLRIYLQTDIHELSYDRFVELGELVAGPLEKLALSADKNPPKLHLRTRGGLDAERIEKHPHYVELERYAFSDFGLAAMSHRPGVFGADRKLPPVLKYGLSFLFVQAEFGLCCPLSMTDALTRTLTKFGDPELVDRFLPNLTTQDFAQLAQGAMFITEQNAGSDIGATTTVARLEQGEWRLYGDKWFCSNPDAALAMVLARAEGSPDGTRGLSLFLLPRHLPDGKRNNYRIVRLKDKLGTRSMPSGEISLGGATAYLIGERGAGFKHMADMINMSRLSNGMRSAGLMRRSVTEALFIARNRRAFDKRLIDLPLMHVQLAKMLTTAEQGRSMVLHTASILDRADSGDEDAAKLVRILTPLIKFRTCRDARKVAGDAMEVRGGCGYIEEWSDARVLRDAHLGSIWEGTSNIVAIDVSRAIRRAGALPALQNHLAGLLDEADIPRDVRPAFDDLLSRICATAHDVANSPNRDRETRQIASALYNIASAVILAWESSRIAGRDNRLALALLVLTHKLQPRDPVAPPADDAQLLADLLSDAPISLRSGGSI